MTEHSGTPISCYFSLYVMKVPGRVCLADLEEKGFGRYLYLRLMREIYEIDFCYSSSKSWNCLPKKKEKGGNRTNSTDLQPSNLVYVSIILSSNIYKIKWQAKINMKLN